MSLRRLAAAARDATAALRGLGATPTSGRGPGQAPPLDRQLKDAVKRGELNQFVEVLVERAVRKATRR